MTYLLSGLVPDFDRPDCCLEEVSGVFKKYIRELPSPLFIDDTPENKLHQEFTKVMECKLIVKPKPQFSFFCFLSLIKCSTK